MSELKKRARAIQKREELHTLLERGDSLTEEELQGICYFLALNIGLVEKEKQKTERAIPLALQQAFNKKQLTAGDHAHLLRQFAEWDNAFEAIPSECRHLRYLAKAT